MKKKILTLLLLMATFWTADLMACTSAIFTGKMTADGRPLMWKHRDTGELNNKVKYFTGGKYAFYALINSPDMEDEAWAGTNAVGFSIMNTASYNLKDDDVDAAMMDKEGVVMFKALASCRTLADFEKMLDKYKRPIGVEANFGVIDAEGGAAYYEVNNDSWTKIDVNDPKIAPQGYMVYTNHSYTGRLDEGMGYVRYTTADRIVKEQIGRNGKISPQWILQKLSRSYYNSVLGTDILKERELVEKCNGWFIDQDFIPRKSSSCAIVFEGVAKGENPANTIMWTILGYPPIGVAVPLMVSQKENIPSFMCAPEDENCRMCDWVLSRKENVFPITRGNGNKYVNMRAVYRLMREALRIENQVFRLAAPAVEQMREGGKGSADFSAAYDFIDQNIR